MVGYHNVLLGDAPMESFPRGHQDVEVCIRVARVGNEGMPDAEVTNAMFDMARSNNVGSTGYIDNKMCAL